MKKSILFVCLFSFFDSAYSMNKQADLIKITQNPFTKQNISANAAALLINHFSPDSLVYVRNYITEGADLNYKIDGYPILHYLVINNGNIEAIQFLLDNKVDVNTPDSQKNRPVHYATQKGNIEVLRILLQYGAEINSANSQGYYPLHIAIKHKNCNAIKLLLENNADVNCLSLSGEHPLHIILPHFEGCVYTAKNFEIATLLLNREEINPNIPYKNSKTTPLHVAVLLYNYELVKQLIDRGANKHAFDDQKRTPVDIARQMQHAQNKIKSLQRQSEDIDQEFVTIDCKSDEQTDEKNEKSHEQNDDDLNSEFFLVDVKNKSESQSCAIQ